MYRHIRFKTLPWLAAGMTFFVILVCVYVLWGPSIKSKTSCWVWRDSDLKLAENCFDWVIYQGDVVGDKSNLFVKRGITPGYVGNHDLTVLFRLYTLPSAEFLAKQLTYTIEQWAIHGVVIKKIQLDYDSPSTGLGRYATYVSSLKPLLPDLSISITGLVSWRDDNLTGLKRLGAEVEYIAFQLYQNYAPLAGAEQYAMRLATYPYPYKLGVTLHKGFADYRFEEGLHYMGQTVFINSRTQ